MAELHTDFPDRFNPGVSVFLAPPDFTGPPSAAVPMEVTSSWLPHGRNAGRIVIGFDSILTIEAAHRLSGLEVVVPDAERIELSDGSAYVDDLVGCTLLDGDIPVGTVIDVQFMTTPDGRRRLTEPTPLLTVDMGSGEALIPFAQAFLISLDLAGKRILMKLPKGLLDLNLGQTKPSLKTESESD